MCVCVCVCVYVCVCVCVYVCVFVRELFALLPPTTMCKVCGYILTPPLVLGLWRARFRIRLLRDWRWS